MEDKNKKRKFIIIISTIVSLTLLFAIVSCSTINKAKKEENVKTKNGDKVVNPTTPKTEQPKDKEPGKPVDTAKPSKTEDSGKPDNPAEPENPVEDPSKPENQEEQDHIHEWEPVYKTVHHSEEGHYEKVKVKEAWDEEVPVYETVSGYLCLSCQKQGIDVFYTDSQYETFKEHHRKHRDGLLPGGGNYSIVSREVQVGSEIIHHEAVYEDKYVVDKPAWDEQVIDYYKCKCGATKH